MEETESTASISATQNVWIPPRNIDRWHSTPWLVSKQSWSVGGKKSPGRFFFFFFFGSGDRQRLNLSLVSFTDSNQNGQTDPDFLRRSSLNAGHVNSEHGIIVLISEWGGFFCFLFFCLPFSPLTVQVLGSNTSGLVFWKLSRSMLRLFPPERAAKQSNHFIFRLSDWRRLWWIFGARTATGGRRRTIKRCQQKLLYRRSTRRWRRV